MTSAIYLIRKLLGGAFGIVALVTGGFMLVAGIAALFLSIYPLGGFHGSGIFYVPIGAILLFVGYGSFRLGWDTLQSSARGSNDGAVE